MHQFMYVGMAGHKTHYWIAAFPMAMTAPLRADHDAASRRNEDWLRADPLSPWRPGAVSLPKSLTWAFAVPNVAASLVRRPITGFRLAGMAVCAMVAPLINKDEQINQVYKWR